MNPYPNKQNPSRVAVQPSNYNELLMPSLAGLRQSEREAYRLIMQLIEPGQMSQADKLSFLRAVETLSSAVHTQENGNMNDYYPKPMLAKKIETFILEESTTVLDSNVRQQAMLCIVALSQVRPPFHLCQKLDLVNVSISSVFSLPLVMPSIDQKESVNLYLQTNQALDDMLQALVMDDMNPNMLILLNFLEIILPWLTLSDKTHEQTRALGTISRLLRFICNFSELSHMASFSINGKLMGIFGLFCMNANQEISAGASEALYYLFTILVLQRSTRPKTQSILKDLQKHFRGNWLANMQNITLFFRKYLTPTERADVLMVAIEAMTSANTQDAFAASKMLKMIMKYTLGEIAKVSEIIQFIYYHMNKITEKTAQNTVKKIFLLLVQSYTDEVILTLFKIKDQSQRGTCMPWEVLASFPKGYRVVMEYLLQKLILSKAPRDKEPGETEISPLIATKAICEMLLVPSQQLELQTFFASLFITLLFQISFLVTQRSAGTQDQQHIAERVDTVSSSIEALKTLLRSSGYMDHLSYIQTLGGWELLVSSERHYDGVTLLARSLVVKNCWHNRPIFSLLIRVLQDPDCANYFTALVFLTELLHCPDVAGSVDDVATNVLANWFRCEEPATVKLLLHMTEIFAKHHIMVRQLCILKPCMISCCYSANSEIVMETFLTLRRLLKDLTWQHSSSFINQLAFILVPFFEEESEQLRLIAFQIYGSILVKVTRRILVFPLRHQILNLLVLLVLHLKDVNADVAEVCRLNLYKTATILGWSKLKEVFTKDDVFTILSALLQQEKNKALWFLKQSMALFKSPQGAIRQAAVWFTGQIIQTLGLAEKEEIEEACTALRRMRRDPDPRVSCLTIQTFYVLEAKEKALLAKAQSSCLCMRRCKRRHF